MSIVNAYHRFLAHALRLWSIACVGVCGFLSAVIVIDWGRGGIWGYPWFSLPVVLLGVGVGIGVFKVTSAWLRHLRA
jgi:hypothetical protein